MFRSAVFLLFVAGALLGGASSAAVAGEGLEPDALLPAKDGQPARIVYVQAQASTRSMIAAFRSEGSAPPAPWSELLPEWSKRARREANDGLWEYALVETASGPGAPKESEILDWLLERKPFPQAPPDSPPALLLFEISGADFRALAQTRDLASGRHDFALPEGFRREARPWVADARKLDAANRFGGRLGLIIRGPAHGSPESAAFLLQAAQIAQSLAPVRLARLRVEPEGLRLVVAETAPSGLREPWTADRVDAWIDETLNAVWDAISRTPDAEALDRLRDQVLLQRRLSFEQPGSRLDFIARRLAAAEPEAVFAEEAALAAATPHDWKTSARAWLAEPEIEVWLPALPAGLSTESAPSAPMAESRRFYQFVHQRTDKDELACVCLLVGLPGGPMGERTFREKSWWGRRREVREAVPISTREEAALMWRALALWAIRERPEASARTAIALPSPLPGAGGADPYGANQYSAIVLQADAEHLPELLDLTATFLGRELSGQPQVETTLAEFDAGRKLLDPARLEAYQQTLRDQARLLAGTSAEAIFERRLKTDAENNLAAAFETLINPANLVIAVSAPADAASVADYLDLRFERAFGDERAGGRVDHLTPRRSTAWPRPAQACFQTPLPAPKSVWAVLDEGPTEHAAALLLATLASGAARASGTGEWTFTALEFEGFLVFYGAAPGDWAQPSDRDRDLKALRRLLDGVGGMPAPALEAALGRLRAEALESRAKRDSGSGPRTFALARNLFLHGDPLYRDAVDAALAKLSPQDVQSVAREASRQMAP